MRIALLLMIFGTLLRAQAAEHGAPVSVSDILERPIYREVQLTGSVTSAQVAQLSAATSGLVLDLRVEEGDTVRHGDLLIQLDDELARHALQAAEARQQQATIALTDAQRRLREGRQLLPKRSIAESTVRDLEAEVSREQAALNAAEADASRQRALLERHQLKAPFDGVISRKLVELGEWITPGQGTFELVAADRLRLDFAVAEDYLSELARDNPVALRLNAIPGMEFSGLVDTIVPVTEPGARTFLLRIVPEQRQPQMMPGMSATARVSIATGRPGLVVPRDATIRYPDGRTVVWTVDGSGAEATAVENIVETGLSFDGMVEIRRGLKAGARVVIRGNEALRRGQPVRVVEQAPVASTPST